MARGQTGDVARELEEGSASLTSAEIAAGVGKVMAQYGPIISRHCGSIPPRLVALRIWVESRGNPNVVAKAQTWHCDSGDVYGSEIGLLQLSPCSRERYGLTAAQAKDPNVNIEYGCRLWNAWSASLGPTDAVAVWAWLVTAIGPGAVRRLQKLAGSFALDALLAVVRSAETMRQNAAYWGSQSPALVAWRVGVAVSAAKVSGALSAGVTAAGLLALGAAGYVIYKYIRR
jgi:hypothetical protein